MLTYYTVLILSYTLDDQQFVAKMMFNSQTECQNTMDAIYPELQKSYTQPMAQCIRSDIASSSIRPKARP